MAVVFTVTGITFTPKETKAATWESPAENDGYIRWNGKSESEYWGVATYQATKSYSYDFTHDGVNSLIAVRNDNAVNATVAFGSPKRTYDAQTEYYFRYVIHSSAAFSSAVYFEGYYAGWGETSLGMISFNAGDTIITGTKTTGNTVVSIATSLKIANLPIGTTVSIDEYYFEKTPYESTTATTTTAAAPTTEDTGWTDYSWPANINGLQFGYTNSYFQYKVDNSTGTVYLKNKDTNPRECHIVYRPNNQNYPEYSGHSYNYRMVFESDTSFNNSNIYGGHYYHNCNTLASSSAIVANQEKVVTLNNYSPPADYTGDGPCLRFDGANFPAGATIAIKSFTVTEPTGGVSDPENVSATRDSETSGTITWSNASTMPSGQYYNIYEGSTKIGTTEDAASNTSFTVNNIADFSSHTYIVKGCDGSEESTGVSATIPAFDTWIPMSSPTKTLADSSFIYDIDAPGTSRLSYYYTTDASTTWKSLKIKKTKAPRPSGYGGYESIKIPGSVFYSGLTNGHRYTAQLKYKADIDSGSVGGTVRWSLPGIYTYSGEITNSGSTYNTIDSGQFTVNTSSADFTTNNVEIQIGEIDEDVYLYDMDVVFTDITVPVAPASVTATRSTSVWNGIDIGFTAGTNPPAGQTYSIEVDGVEIENNATPGNTYTATIDYDEDITVEVIAHIADQTASETTTINIPEYKPISQLNNDPIINSQFRQDWSSDSEFKYKVDSGNLVIKNYTDAAHSMNLYYYQTALSDTVPYYVTYTYTSNAASTSTVNYGAYSSSTGCLPTGSMSKTTTASSGNIISYLTTPTVAQVSSGAYAYINWTLPAGAEYTVTACTVAAATTAVDVASVTGTSFTANTVVASWVEGSNPPAYQNYVVDLLDSSDTVVDTATVAAGITTCTFNNVAKGTGYKVRVKAKVDEAYASAAGVSSTAFEVYDPAAVAPVIGTCIENPNRAQSIKLRFAEGTGASAQTYTVSIDGYAATPDSGSVAPDTDLYFSEVNGAPLSVGNHSVVVTATNTEGTATDTEAVTLEWNRASSSWVTGPDNYEFFESYDGTDFWGQLAYKGTSLANLNVRVDENGSVYDVQMRKANAQMYSGLSSGRTYTMTFTFRSTQAGTVGWSQEGYGISGTAAVTANQDTEITSTFIYDSSKNTRTVDEQEVANNFNLDLSGLPDGAVLTNFDVDFEVDPWVVVPSGQQGYDPMPLGDGTGLRSQDTGDTAYYYGTDTSFKTIRTKQLMANPRTVDDSFWDELRIPANIFYTGITDQHWYKAVITYKASAASGSIKVAMPWVGNYVGAITNSGNTPNTITSDEFLYNASDVGKFEEATVEFMIGAVGTGVEISDIDVTFIEQPRPVTGLVALSENAQGRNDGQSITAKWNDPISGISQSYVAKLYNANDVLLDTSAAIAGGSGAYSYTFTNVSPINAYYYVVVESTMSQITVSETSAQVLLSPWTPMITTEEVTVGTNTGVSIYNTDNGRLGYWYNCTGAGKDIGDVKVKMIDGRIPTIDNPENSFWERINYDNESVFSGLINGGQYRLTMTYTAGEVPQDGGGNVWIYPGNGATLPQGTTYWADSDGVQSGENTITGDFTYNSAAAVGQVMQIRLAGLEGGVEISNISFNIEELPVPVSGLVAIPSAGNVITARWVAPTGGTGQTYVAELYNSNDQRIAYSTSLPNNTTSYDFTGVTPDANYYVKVVSSLNGETATATSTPVYLDPWVQVVGAAYGGQPISAGNATVFSQYGAISYYYGHTSSLNDLQIKRTAAAESTANAWFDQIYQTNDVVYANCNDGYSYRMAVTYTANSAATGNLIVRRQMDGNQDTVIPVESGTHTVNIDFTYNEAYSTSSYKTLFLLGGINADSVISGISYTITELSTWTPGTPGGWQDVGNYGYYIPANHTGSYSTDVGYNFSLKAGEYVGEWSYMVGTRNMEVYPGSTYAYSINFNRDTKVDNPEHPEFEVLHLYVTYDNGTTEKRLQDATPDASGNVSFSGNIDVPEGATTARLFIKSQWVAGNTILSVDAKSGETYTFEEIWRPVDKLQEVRDGRYVISDRDGGEIMYKPTQTEGTGSISARVINGTEWNPDRPSIKTQFENWNLEEGEEYVATVKVTANKNCDFRIHGDQTVYSLTADTETTIPITFIYSGGYNIQADLGWLGAQDVILSSYSITVSEGSATMELKNEDSHVKADWSDYEGAETPGKLVYTSNGEQQIVDITGTTQYEFKEGDGEHGYPDNDTEVEIYDTYEEGNPGTKLLRATALADFKIVDARVDGIAHANTNNIIKMTLRNIGTGKVIASDANQKFIYLTARQDQWRNYKYLCPDPQDLQTSVVLNPNEEFDENSPFYERPSIDAWRVAQEGVYTITCQVNETKIIREKDYTNNTFTFTKEVSTQLADDTAVLGFQLNSNKTEGGPSQYNPSFRTVCRANKQVVVKDGDTAWTDEGTSETVPTGTYNVKAYGFVYALRDQAGLNSKNEDELMSFKGATENDYINTYEAQEEVDITEWTTKEGSTYNQNNSNFFALTIKDLYYTTDQYETTYTFRSYLQFEAGGKTYTVYPKDVYSTSMYDIAEDLYRYKKMPSEEAHNFLYDNILNIVSMKHNYGKINLAMKEALYWGDEYNADNAEIADNIAKDMYYYALCSDPKDEQDAEHLAMVYKYSDITEGAKPGLPGINYGEDHYMYTHDHQFRSFRLDDSGEYDSFLATLNKEGVRYYSDTSYDSVYDWIYGEIDHDDGFYQRVEYSWDSNLDKDFGTE